MILIKSSLLLELRTEGVGSGEWGVGSGRIIFHSPLPTPHSPLPLKHILQSKLYLTWIDRSVNRTAEARRFQHSHRDREMGAIEEIERFDAEQDGLSFGHVVIFDQREVG